MCYWVGSDAAALVVADGCVLDHGQLVHALQSVVDPAAVDLLRPTRAGLLVLVLALEG